MNETSVNEVSMLYGIPREELTSFRDFIRIYDRGETIIREGEVDKSLYLLRHGSVGIYRQMQNHQEAIDTIEAVNFVGEMSLINDEPRSATVMVSSDKALVYALTKPNVSIILSNPKWAELLISRLSKNLARNNATKVTDTQKIHELERKNASLRDELEKQKETNQLLLQQAQATLDSVLYFEIATRDRAIVGSKGWAYLKALIDLTKALTRHYLPTASISEKSADLKVVKQCLADVQRSTPGTIFEDLEKG
jgi:CRP/FNR family cyclic AMP-dependent transcriptional regulator